jgi:tight adherence protein B
VVSGDRWAMSGRARQLAAAVRRRREAADVETALPDLLERVAGELRAGAAPLVALREAAGGADLAVPLRADLARVVARAERDGLSLAVAAWAQERPLPAVAAVAAALEVAVGAGGPAVPALDGLAAGLRDRRDAIAEIAALSAQARLSAIVVGAAPVVSLGLSLLADRRVAPTLLATGPGRACLLAGIALEALAAAWMSRILRCDR